MQTEYIRLIEGFAPVVIHDDNQARATEYVVETLLAKERSKGLDDAESTYLDLLSQLLSDWEDQTVKLPNVIGQDLVKVLMKDRGLSQRDLVRAGIFATDSVASEVLAGHRQFTVEHVARLSQYFNLPADLFIPELQPA